MQKKRGMLIFLLAAAVFLLAACGQAEASGKLRLGELIVVSDGGFRVSDFSWGTTRAAIGEALAEKEIIELDQALVYEETVDGIVWRTHYNFDEEVEGLVSVYRMIFSATEEEYQENISQVKTELGAFMPESFGGQLEQFAEARVSWRGDDDSYVWLSAMHQPELEERQYIIQIHVTMPQPVRR